MFEIQRQRLLAASPAELAREWKTHSPDADLTFLTEEATCIQEALAARDRG